MKAIVKVILFIVMTSSTACFQSVEEKLVGSWGLNSNYESPDIIIFRSDHKYFVYNSNSVDTESLGLTENLKSDDILIDDSYTSMTEKGTWSYNNATKVLTLRKRNILEKWTDFSEVYGKSEELKFYLKQITRNKIRLCFADKVKQFCEEYTRDWRTNNGEKIFYREISKKCTGVGNKTKEILLTGYETELKLSYVFYKEFGKLVIEDKTGKVLFLTDITEVNERRKKEIDLRGVTKLVFKVVSSKETCHWEIGVEIK